MNLFVFIIIFIIVIVEFLDEDVHRTFDIVDATKLTDDESFKD